MESRLIMLPNPILVSDENPTKWYLDDTYTIRISFTDDEHYWSKRPEYKKIIAGIEGLPKLDLSAIAERIGWVDVEKLAKKFIKEEWVTSDEPVKFGIEVGYEEGFKAAQSLNEKKYSEEELKDAIFYALSIKSETCCTTNTKDSTVRSTIKSLSKPKEYNVVEFTQEENTIKVTKILE